MYKIAITTILFFVSVSYLQAQKSILNQGRSQIRKAEREAKRTQRDFNRVGKLFSDDKRQVSQEDNLSDTIIWEKERYIPQRGVLNDYSYLFQSIHGVHEKVLFKNTGDLNKIVWDSTTNKYYNRLDKINSINDNYTVYGWHPYWMTNDYQYYNYDLLSMISYFSYDVDPYTGSYTDEEAILDWRTTPMIDSAKAHNTKVLLSITSYGEQRNRRFLNDKMAWDGLIDSLKVLINERKADGIDIDFEEMPSDVKLNFTDFVKKLNIEFEANRDEFIISLQVPAYNNNSAIDFVGLDPFVDLFIIHGYDYTFTECNSVPAPVAPLSSINTDCPCIINTYDYSIRNGLNPQKALLGLPVYGTEWTLSGNSWDAKATFERYITYEDVMSEYDVNYQPTYDPISGSTYYFVSTGKNKARVVWFESEQSMDMKFTWAKDHDMKGVALWSLGYDGAQPGIWNAIATNFGVDPLVEIQPIGYDNGKLYSIMATFHKYKGRIGVGIAIIVYFFLAGLFISLLDWRVREIFFANFTYRAVFAGVIIGLSALSIFLINDNSGYLFPLFIGLVLGALVVYIISNRYISYRDKLP